jgi:hypothetical protein
MFDRERHTGELGDCYQVSSGAVKYSHKRAGNGDFVQLQSGDILVRVAHSGDCFSTYAVFRNGFLIKGCWAGYDGVGSHIGNVGLAVLTKLKQDL